MGGVIELLLRGAGAAAVGLLALTAGGAWAALRPPSTAVRLVTQHLAAGTVFAGLTAAVLPSLLRGGANVVAVAGGMALGLCLMIFVRWSGERKNRAGSGKTLAFAIVADVLTDGVLMGLSVAGRDPVAIVFVVALAPELTLLGLTLSDELGGRSWRWTKRVGVPALLGVGVVVGGVLGACIATGPAALATAIRSFGAIALAYLVTEELLREAHRKGASPWLAAAFFAGFVPFFVAAVVVRGMR